MNNQKQHNTLQAESYPLYMNITELLYVHPIQETHLWWKKRLLYTPPIAFAIECISAARDTDLVIRGHLCASEALIVLARKSQKLRGNAGYSQPFNSLLNGFDLLAFASPAATSGFV